jgi:hypothetical protein
LLAASLVRPVPRSRFAPVLRPIDPVAVVVSGSGDRLLVRAADASRVTTASGPDGLSALAEFRVSGGAEFRTLVVADRDTLSRLLELARATDPASARNAGGAVPVSAVVRPPRPTPRQLTVHPEGDEQPAPFLAALQLAVRPKRRCP